MPVQLPTLDEIADIADGFGLSLDGNDIKIVSGTDAWNC